MICVQTLLGRMGDEIRLGFAVEVSEADESCLVTVTYGGNAFKPLMGCSDSLSMVCLLYTSDNTVFSGPGQDGGI